MEYVLTPIVVVVVILIGLNVSYVIQSIKAPNVPVMIDQPKPRVKDWTEEMMDRVWKGSMVAVFTWNDDRKGYHIDISKESNLSNLRKYKCDIMTALNRLEGEKDNVGDNIPEYDRYGAKYDYERWTNELRGRREFISGIYRQIETLVFRVQTAIDLELDKQGTKVEDTQQLALDF